MVKLTAALIVVFSTLLITVQAHVLYSVPQSEDNSSSLIEMMPTEFTMEDHLRTATRILANLCANGLVKWHGHNATAEGPCTHFDLEAVQNATAHTEPNGTAPITGNYTNLNVDQLTADLVPHFNSQDSNATLSETVLKLVKAIIQYMNQTKEEDKEEKDEAKRRLKYAQRGWARAYLEEMDPEREIKVFPAPPNQTNGPLFRVPEIHFPASFYDELNEETTKWLSLPKKETTSHSGSTLLIKQVTAIQMVRPESKPNCTCA